jgi:hypothetical protein
MQPNAITVRKSAGSVSAYAPDGTCIYLRTATGFEVVNATSYSALEIAQAQEQAAVYFEVCALGPIFVDKAPVKIDMMGLALLGLLTQLSEVLSISNKVVDGGKLNTVET